MINHNYLAESHERENTFAGISHTELPPLSTAVIGTGDYLQSAADAKDAYSLGFTATLKAIVRYGVSPEEQLYVFDRGDKPRFGILTQATLDRRHIFLPADPAFRYVVMSPSSLRAIDDAGRNNLNTDLRQGWGMFGAGEDLNIGRNQQMRDALRLEPGPSISADQAQIVFGDQGELRVRGLDSANRTTIISGNAPNCIVDEAASLGLRGLGKLMPFRLRD